MKRQGEDVKEFPQSNRKRSRSPKKVDFQIEKPPLHEDPVSERVRNKRMLSSVIVHLTKAKESLTKQKEVIEIQSRIDEKISQEIKKTADDIKNQKREEIAVKMI